MYKIIDNVLALVMVLDHCLRLFPHSFMLVCVVQSGVIVYLALVSVTSGLCRLPYCKISNVFLLLLHLLAEKSAKLVSR